MSIPILPLGRCYVVTQYLRGGSFIEARSLA